MNHLHTCLYLEKNGSVQVSLDCPGNVFLMKDTEYKKYSTGEEFKAIGGLVTTRKKVLHVPKEGTWHLVIDNNEGQESINVALNITNGRQISENEMNEQPPEEKPPQTKPRKKDPVPDDKEHRKFLQNEIIKKINEISLEGLAFLIDQAKTLLHNQEMDKINNEVTDYDDEYVIRALPKNKKKADVNPNRIDIEEHSENTFFLVMCGTRKILSRQELRIIVDMSHQPMNDAAFSKNLFEWLKIRRNDILFDAKIRSYDHPVWPALRRFLRSRYKAKK
ncbi:MAG: DUF1883 domain-containing protein [Spirochaetales bacterium]|nr:DUF1883 domain-containing protein [Spirochaetales bacterium]